MRELIESAFLSGYEPSNDNLSMEQIYEEAKDYLLKMI